jgi:hypothetical protein
MSDCCGFGGSDVAPPPAEIPDPLVVDTLDATTINVTTLNATNANVAVNLVSATTGTFNGLTAVGATIQVLQAGGFVRQAVITPDLVASPQNDLAVLNIDIASLFKFFSSVAGPISVTGVVPGTDGQEVVFMNQLDSTANISIEHENAGSAAQNRFHNGSGAAVVLAPGQTATYLYDPDFSRWIQIT